MKQLDLHRDGVEYDEQVERQFWMDTLLDRILYFKLRNALDLFS